MVLALATALGGCDEKKNAAPAAPASGTAVAAASGAALAAAVWRRAARRPPGAAVAPSGAVAPRGRSVGERRDKPREGRRSRDALPAPAAARCRTASAEDGHAPATTRRRRRIRRRKKDATHTRAVVPSRRVTLAVYFARRAGCAADARVRRRGAGGVAAGAAARAASSIRRCAWRCWCRRTTRRHGIAATLATIAPQLRAGDRLVVVADNCSDATAAVARARRRRRVRALRRGRIAARASPSPAASRISPANEPDIVIIVDADCRVEAGAIDALRAAAVERPAQAAYVMRAPDGAPPTRRLAELHVPRAQRGAAARAAAPRRAVPAHRRGHGVSRGRSCAARRWRRAASSRICSSRSISPPTGRRRASAARRA